MRDQAVHNRTSSSKMLFAMVTIGTVCALLIVLTYEGTFSRIAYLQDEALKAAIFKVLPGTSSTETYVLNVDRSFEPTTETEKDATVVYAGYDDQNKLTGIAVEASGQGYAGVIRILYGYDPSSEQVVGFYVLQSNETPGLGDKIEKDENFLANFQGLYVSLSEDGLPKHEIKAVKTGTKEHPWEIEAITGATISSRAIADIIDASAKQIIPVIAAQKDIFKQGAS